MTAEGSIQSLQSVQDSLQNVDLGEDIANLLSDLKNRLWFQRMTFNAERLELRMQTIRTALMVYEALHEALQRKNPGQRETMYLDDHRIVHQATELGLSSEDVAILRRLHNRYNHAKHHLNFPKNLCLQEAGFFQQVDNHPDVVVRAEPSGKWIAAVKNGTSCTKINEWEDSYEVKTELQTQEGAIALQGWIKKDNFVAGKHLEEPCAKRRRFE